MFNFKFNGNMFSKLNNKFMNKFNNSANRGSRFVGEYKVVKQEELPTFVQQDLFILDVRTEAEFKGMHLKNAVNIPLMVLSRDIQNIVPDKETKILVYCVTGERTMVAIQKLNNLGYRNVYIWGNGGLNTLKNKDILEY